MASRKPYECFRCRDNGFPITMVYLAGKDDQGKTIYIEDDGTAHRHKTKEQAQQSQQQHQEGTTVFSEPTQLKVIVARLEYAITLLEKITNVTATTTGM